MHTHMWDYEQTCIDSQTHSTKSTGSSSSLKLNSFSSIFCISLKTLCVCVCVCVCVQVIIGSLCHTQMYELFLWSNWLQQLQVLEH